MRHLPRSGSLPPTAARGEPRGAPRAGDGAGACRSPEPPSPAGAPTAPPRWRRSPTSSRPRSSPGRPSGSRGEEPAKGAQGTVCAPPPQVPSSVSPPCRCQNWEGGIGGVPGMEAHGGYTFCGVAALVILKKEHLLNLRSLLVSSGGAPGCPWAAGGCPRPRSATRSPLSPAALGDRPADALRGRLPGPLQQAGGRLLLLLAGRAAAPAAPRAPRPG